MRHSILYDIFSCTLFFLASIMSASAQQTQASSVTFTGTVQVEGTADPVAGANILLQTKDGRGLLGFSSTDGEGRFRLEYKSSAERDSVKLTVTGFNLKKTTKTIPYASQTVNFSVVFEEMQIKEVIVKSEPVVRKSDTLNYYVSNYIDSLDRSIGDVIRKMPGIDVLKSGQILYNNKPINKFYIEGLDMMGGRYGLATNNVRAKDIASVQVLENHQPIKALKDVAFSDAAAINLKLKDKAKGAFAATLLLGAGYRPWMWNGELAAMQFSSNFQFLGTYKTNNSGNDVTSELNSFYGGVENTRQLTDVHMPSPPAIDKERYMDNTTHAVSANALVKLKEDHTLTFNGKYIHDLQKYRSESTTTYYLPDVAPLEINEGTYASKLSDGMDVSLRYQANTEKLYLMEKAVFAADWNRNDGQVQTDTSAIEQRFRMEPRLRLRNDLNITKVINGLRLNVNSNLGLSQLPTTLTVSPVPYPQIFGTDALYNSAVQSLSTRGLNTTNTITTGRNFKRFYISGGLGFNAKVEDLQSHLFPTDREGNELSSPDSLSNDVYWQQFDLRGVVYATYMYGGLSINLSADVDWMNLNVADKIRKTNKTMNRLLVNPSFSLSARLSPDLKLSAGAYLGHNVGSGASGTYSGYIMSDYRVVGSRDGQIAESQRQNYRIGLDYGNALISLFATLNGSYWRNKSNVMYGTRYYGSLSRVETYAIDNVSQGFNVSGKIEKRFDEIATTVGIPVSYNRNYTDILRQGELMKTVFWTLPVGLEISASFFNRKFRTDYEIEYSRSKSVIKNFTDEIIPIDALRQNLNFHILPIKQLSLTIGGEHYFNSTITDGSRSMFFVDATINYKTRRFEYILEGRNLTCTNWYNQRLYSDITAFAYSYRLRPVSVMFKVKFSIR